MYNIQYYLKCLLSNEEFIFDKVEKMFVIIQKLNSKRTDKAMIYRQTYLYPLIILSARMSFVPCYLLILLQLTEIRNKRICLSL